MDKCTICHVSVTEFRMRNLPCAQQRGLAKSTFTPRFFGTTDLHVNDGLYKSNSYSISLTLSQPPTVVAPQPGPVSVNGYKYKSNNRLAFGLDQFHTHTHTHPRWPFTSNFSAAFSAVYVSFRSFHTVFTHLLRIEASDRVRLF